MRGRPHMALAWLGVVSAVLAGCYEAPPAEPYTLRLEARGMYADIVHGRAAVEDRGASDLLQGGSLSFSNDLDLGAAAGYGLQLDLRPTSNAELRLAFNRIDRFKGRQTLTANADFEDLHIEAGTKVDGEVAWDRADMSYAHRLVPLVSEEDVGLDLLVRGGVEFDHFDARVEAAGESAQEDIYGAAPFGGVELRFGLFERVFLRGELRLGYLAVGDFRASIVQVETGLRFRILGPLDLGVFYEYGIRKARYAPTDGLAEVEITDNIVGLAVGLAF